VLTTHGAPWHELETQHCGWWIPVGQEALDMTLPLVLTASEGELREMGARGTALVNTKYMWKGIGHDLRALYKWMLNQGPRPEFFYGDGGLAKGEKP
jgi:hypothetical protein